MTLALFNVAGQVVAVLVDEHLQAGLHERSWDSARQASGVYLYRLTAAGKDLVGKMVLLQ